LRAVGDYEWAFSHCDFSGCKIYDPGFLSAQLKSHRNYYVRGNPPLIVGSVEAVEWDALLVCETTKPNFWAF
jgi:hypothetical protein